jgi:tRNA U34 5-carboxymethylaminomethyl modifying enzyme MnmG/GidA
MRLTPLARSVGLVHDDQWNSFLNKKEALQKCLRVLQETCHTPHEWRAMGVCMHPSQCLYSICFDALAFTKCRYSSLFIIIYCLLSSTVFIIIYYYLSATSPSSPAPMFVRRHQALRRQHAGSAVRVAQAAHAFDAWVEAGATGDLSRDASRSTCSARPLTLTTQAAAESCGAADTAMLATVENECVYTNYVKREDKEAAGLLRNMDAVLPKDFEYQVTCDV